MVDMAEYAFKEILPILRIMGRERWLTARPHPTLGNVSEFKIAEARYRCDPATARGIAKVMAELRRHSPAGAAAVYALSRCLANGPKCYRPTEEAAEAMLEVEARIEAQDYQQPYPQLVVEFPNGFRRLVAERRGRPVSDLPRSCLLHREDDMFVFVCRYADCERTVTFSLRPGKQLEDLIAAPPGDANWTSHVTADLLRSAINCTYLLMHYGFAEDDSERQRVRRKKPKLLFRTPVEVVLAQEVTVRVVRRRGAELDGPGTSPRPHWRRGHWARVPCGPGRAERRLVLRRPTFVRVATFGGDLADTSVTLRGGGA